MCLSIVALVFVEFDNVGNSVVLRAFLFSSILILAATSILILAALIIN
jgi:hypothetical protein